MSADVLAIPLTAIRGSDSNSLLRLYDAALAISSKSPLQRDRERADKVLQRIAKELQKRKILL